MKSKFLFTTSCLVVVSFIIFIGGCNDKHELHTSNPKGDFNGLYTVEYEKFDINYIWIFSDDIRYVLYPGATTLDTDNTVNYEEPTHYYIDGKKFYSCGVGANMKAVSLRECKNRESEPRFNIISIDTIEDNFSSYKFQVILLEEYYGKDKIKLKRKL